MNTPVHLESYCPLPSERLPCCRLPTRVHLQLCRELEGPNKLWEKLARGFTLAKGGREIASLSSDTVIYFRKLGRWRTATALLEYLWKEERVTVGDLLDAFGGLDIRGSVSELLCDYLDGKLAAAGDADSVDDDPRDQVGVEVFHCHTIAYLCGALHCIKCECMDTESDEKLGTLTTIEPERY